MSVGSVPASRPVAVAVAQTAPPGMSPAKIEVDSTHMSASAIANRFMDVAPLRLRKCQCVYIKKNGTLRQDFLQGRLERTNIPFAFAQLLRHSKVSILMRTTSPKLDISHLTPNEQAELRCRTALELKDRNEYDAAREAMFPIWNGNIGSRPNTKGLHRHRCCRSDVDYRHSYGLAWQSQ